jgi:hypothetical protein
MAEDPPVYPAELFKEMVRMAIMQPPWFVPETEAEDDDGFDGYGDDDDAYGNYQACEDRQTHRRRMGLMAVTTATETRRHAQTDRQTMPVILCNWGGPGGRSESCAFSQAGRFVDWWQSVDIVSFQFL